MEAAASSDRIVPTAASPFYVLIPSYNQQAMLVKCLASLQASEGIAPHVLVVDDCSEGDLVVDVRRHFPWCEVLVNERNLGFGATCNLGFQHALDRGADLILLLNQDTTVAPGLVPKLLRFMEDHPRAGIVGPKTYSFDSTPDGRPRLLYAGSWQGLLPLRQRIPGIEEPEEEIRRDPVQVDFVWGHGMLIRASALRETGGFDPAFPMYYEDLDLCRRVREAGYELWCEPDAVMWHDQFDGARAARSEYWRWAYKVRSTNVYHRKHYGRLASQILTPLTFVAELRQLLWRRQGRAAGHLLLAALRYALGLQEASLRSKGKSEGKR